MNKLQFHEGGQPLHLDDLEFLQDATVSTIRSLISSWGDCVLGGCEITYDKNTYAHHWKAGYIAYQGEVYRVSAGKFDQVDQADTFYWLFSKTEVGGKVFEDGEEHNTQIVYTAQLASLRFAPEDGDYVADSHLPRLGIDFARSPRLRYSYEGLGVLIDFTELSRYSGIITLRFEKTDSIPTSGHFGIFRLSGINNMSGKSAITAYGFTPTTIEVINGKLVCNQTLGEGRSSSHAQLYNRTYVSILISWDYEESNGAGAGINNGGDSGSGGNWKDAPPRSQDRGGNTGSGAYDRPPRRR
jgi:hypothetical protein|nr:MAG TPA: hypothetical protein [Caudoviricetes sp.]